MNIPSFVRWRLQPSNTVFISKDDSLMYVRIVEGTLMVVFDTSVSIIQDLVIIGKDKESVEDCNFIK